jgi:thiol-disulfide isomerase/thioredoxin
MKEVKADKAVEFIGTAPLLHVMWHKDNCPVCEHFTPELEKIEKGLPNWKFIKVNYNEHKKSAKQLTWEPTQFPISYLFVNGERIFVATGAAPSEAIIDTHNQIENGTWRSPKVIEQEQLDALDK